MARHATDEHQIPKEMLPRVEIPPVVKPTDEELARRRAVIAEILEPRERIGPIGIAAGDLIHAARAEDVA